MHELFCNSCNLLWHSCREQPCAFFVWRCRKDVYDVFVESHVQHFISFVKNTIVDLRDVYQSSVNHILHSTWSSHNNLCSSLNVSSLLCNTCSTVNCYHINTFFVFRVVFNFVGNLQTKFASWR
ncbi:hypothetical protein D3C85_56830 [compost metagenome]